MKKYKKVEKTFKKAKMQNTLLKKEIDYLKSKL